MVLSANNGILGKRLGKPRFTAFEAVRFLSKAGFEAVDVNFFPTTYHGDFHDTILDGDWRSNIEQLKEEIKACGLITESAHGPKVNADEPQEVYQEYLRRSIEAAGMLGAKHMVVHPLMAEDKSRTLVDETIRYFDEFEKYAKEIGVSLAVENMKATSAEDLLAISGGLGCGVCWDTGHANIAGRSQYESVTALGDSLKVLHVHDNYGTADNHNPPGFGTVDWNGFMQGLKDIGYSGCFNFEINAMRLWDGARMENARYLVKVGKLLTGRADDVLE